jgi:uncharacterized phage-associated protein
MIYIISAVFLTVLFLVTLRKEGKLQNINVMAYNPKDIADYFLYIGKDDQTMTPMKLIKLVYIAHGWYLGLNNENLINEPIQAWKYGTVIPSLYEKFRHFRGNKITDIPNSEPIIVLDEDKSFLNKVYEIYKKYTGLELSAKTHQPNTPWTLTWNKAIEGNGTINLTIPDALIKNYYKALSESK